MTTSTFQTIRSLREAGNLADAFRQAKGALDAEPDNIWHRRAMADVYADLLKEASAQPAPDRLLRGLRTILDFPMAHTEIRWREQILWSVNRYLLRATPDLVPFRVLAELVALSREFLNEGPSLVRSVWLKALLKHTKTGLDWLSILDDGGWDAFRPEDHQAETAPDGTTYSPLLERICTVVARQLIKTTPLLEDKVQPILDWLQRLATQHPDWAYLPYYQAKLLLQLNQPNEAYALFLPIARQKQGPGQAAPFWIWAMMADLLSSKPEQAIDCYARALSGSSPESYLVNVRQKLAATLIQQGLWNEARTEIDRLVATRQHEGWKLPLEVQQWLNDDAYTQATAAPAGWSADRAQRADLLLWADLPEHTGLVVAVDPERHRLTVAMDAQQQIYFPTKLLGQPAAIGSWLAIRMTQEMQDGKTRTRVQTVRLGQQQSARLTTRELTGTLRITDRGFGFVEDVFVGAELLTGSLISGSWVTVSAYTAWDSRKETVGWKAFIIRETVVNSGII